MNFRIVKDWLYEVYLIESGAAQEADMDALLAPVVREWLESVQMPYDGLWASTQDGLREKCEAFRDSARHALDIANEIMEAFDQPVMTTNAAGELYEVDQTGQVRML